MGANRFALLFFVLFMSVACDMVDNQQITKSEDFEAANPKPIPRNVAMFNANHKVLVASISNGVDYNHPLLAPNLHFRQNASGVGYDFVGNDNWPAPYVAMTSRYDGTLDPDDRKTSLNKFSSVDLFLKKYPEFISFMNNHRNIEQEVDQDVYLGTYLAGLITYDRPDIGLLPYRISPNNVMEGDWMGLKHNYRLDTFNRLKKAIELAIKDGASIVNISLYMYETEPAELGNTAYEEHLMMKAELSKIINAHPNVMFVSAAGDDGYWVDGKKHLLLPCNTDATNVLCVSALDEKEKDPAVFTNILLNRYDVVFALGEKVLSIMPTNVCRFNYSDMYDEDGKIPPENYVLLSAAIREKCANRKLTVASGTVVAAALVTRIAALTAIRHPGLSGSELIKKVIGYSEKGNIGPLPIFIVNVPKPSWYPPQLTRSKFRLISNAKRLRLN